MGYFTGNIIRDGRKAITIHMTGERDEASCDSSYSVPPGVSKISSSLFPTTEQEQFSFGTSRPTRSCGT